MVEFPPFLTRVSVFVNFCLPAHQTPSEKGCTLKGKHLLLRACAFSGWRKNNFDRIASPESVSISFNLNVISSMFFFALCNSVLVDLLKQPKFPYIFVLMRQNEA